jgi:hypothetical protein
MTPLHTSPQRTDRPRILARVLGLSAILVVLATVAGCGLIGGGDTKENGADVGACASVTGSSFSADFEEVDCDDAKASFVVTGKGETCDENEVEYKETINGNESVKLCLDYNATKGDCFDIPTVGVEPGSKVECTKGDTASLKVTATGDDAKAKCPGKQDVPLPNKTRNTLICFASNA